MKANIFLLCSLIAIGTVVVLHRAQSKGEETRAEVEFEVVAAEPLVPRSAQSATAAAFSALAGRVRFDQPLWVESLQNDKGEWSVRFFSVPRTAFSATVQPHVKDDQKVAEVRFADAKMSITIPRKSQKDDRDVFINEGTSAAIVYLAGVGALREKFLLRAGPGLNAGECSVLLEDRPAVPGAHVLVIVTESGMEIVRGE